MNPEDLLFEVSAQWQDYLSFQPEHEVYLPIKACWDLGHNAIGCFAQSGQRVALDESFTKDIAYIESWSEPKWVTWDVLKAMVVARKGMIKQIKNDPFMAAWISEFWRPALIKLCDLRLNNPGNVIKWFVTGGNRPGKTETCTYFLILNLMYHCRPYGSEDDPDWRGRVMMLHETEAMSASQHHPVVFKYLPAEVKGRSKHQKTNNTYFNYTSTGFSDGRFLVEMDVTDETGRRFTGGGSWEARNYMQEMSTFQGGEFDCILSDELLPPDYFKTLNARLASRAFVTRDARYLDRIRHLRKLLVAGPIGSIARAELLPLIGALMQSVHIVSFTPIKGYTALAKWFLSGAAFNGWREAPILQEIAGCRDTKVPTFASCLDPTAMVFFLPSSANIFKPAYQALISEYRLAGERELRMRLYGHVDQDTKTLFGAWDDERHLCSWEQLPREGTIYVVVDPAAAKPWAICIYIVDSLGRIWQAMEWPCETIPIGGGTPGPWAVTSVADRLNGDEGPAYGLRLNLGIPGQLVVIWEMLAMFLRKMAESGKPWKGESATRTVYHEGIETQMDVAMPECCVFDSRFVGAKVTVRGEDRGEEEVTVLTRISEDPNMAGIWCAAASGKKLDEGDTLIASMLAEGDGLGGAKFRLERGCTNTRFMFRSYTLPVFRDVTRAADEACKEWRDCLAYLLLSNPEYRKTAPPPTWLSGGTF